MTSYLEWRTWNPDPIPYSDHERQVMATTDYDDPRYLLNDVVPAPVPGRGAVDSDFNTMVATGKSSTPSPILPTVPKEAPPSPTPMEVIQQLMAATSSSKAIPTVPASSSSTSFKPSSLRRRRSSSRASLATQVIGEISSDSEGETEEEA